MAVDIRGLSLAYNGRPVLEDFSLLLPDKGIVCFLGPSGCGKTTLLHALSGLLPVQGGRVEGLAGRRMSFVFQQDRLLPWATARENVAFVLPEPGPAGEWLEKMELSGEADKTPRELSGGMCRRVAIARAMAYGGDVYVLDEPFRGLDAATRNRVREWVRQRVTGALTLWVTHDAAEAVAFSDRIIVLQGPPLAVLRSVDVDAARRDGPDGAAYARELLERVTAG